MNLITDHTSAVSAKVLPHGVQGVIRPSVGDPEDLVLDFINSAKTGRVGQTVVTSGWRAQGLASLFPPGIPVGDVVKASVARAGGEPAGPRATIRRSAQTWTSCRC